MMRLGVLESVKRGSNHFNTKIKGTFIEKFVNYMKNVFTDYKEVGVSVRQDIKTQPVKATFFFTGMGLLGYSLTHNPDEQSFKAKFIQCANEVSLVQPTTVNPQAVAHCEYLQNCFNKELIRYRSFGVFSVIWVDKYSNQCNTFEAKCSYLQVSYRKIYNQVVDVGFWNIWWVISRKMLDYDINY